MKCGPKYQIGQVVYAWKQFPTKITMRYFQNEDNEFDGWWYGDGHSDYSERELRPLTQREIGLRRETKGRT